MSDAVTGADPAAGTAERADPCDICRATEGFDPDLEVSLVGVFDARIHRCRRCGFRQVRPRVTPAELRRLYPQDYFDSGSPIGFRDYARQQQRNEREAWFLARRLRQRAERGRVLEVGCAFGFLLEALRRFSGWEVAGLDVSPFAAYFARRRYGLEVDCATLEAARFPDDHFDFVIQKDLLEHVTHPRDHLHETFRVLKPGGEVWLVTPNGDANLRPLERLAGELRSAGRPLLPMLDQGHLQFFQQEHLLRLFQDCGFECLHLHSVGIGRGLRALGVLPRKRGKRKTAPAGRPRGGGPPPAAADPAELERLYARVAAEVEQRHRGSRGSVAYYWFREAMRQIDSLPGDLPIGNDFDCLLRKPDVATIAVGEAPSLQAAASPAG
jgi:2-polyprenyl-3-methyl-5-hydroxy-6-metoxy-1,4-benzoquinol methylase